MTAAFPGARLLAALAGSALLHACAAGPARPLREPAAQAQPVTPEDRARAFPDEPTGCRYSDGISPRQVAVLRRDWAAGNERLYNALWTGVRSQWNTFTAAEGTLLGQLGWGLDGNPTVRATVIAPCPRSPVNYAPGDATNRAGEQFLRINHEQLQRLNARLSAEAQKDPEVTCVTGWEAMPDPENHHYPVPDLDLHRDGDPDDPKSDFAFDQMRQWERFLTDPRELARFSLSQVGFMAELTIHNWMHMRWARPPEAADQRLSPVALALMGKEPPAEAVRQENDNLGHPFSAQANPIYWKIHAWLDNLIVHWLRAHGYERIQASCGAEERGCYEWGAPSMVPPEQAIFRVKQVSAALRESSVAYQAALATVGKKVAGGGYGLIHLPRTQDGKPLRVDPWKGLQDYCRY
jgi:hypothetical protein